MKLIEFEFNGKINKLIKIRSVQSRTNLSKVTFSLINFFLQFFEYILNSLSRLLVEI